MGERLKKMKIELTLEELYYISEADYNFKEFFKESLEKLRKCNDYVMLFHEEVPENEMIVKLNFELVIPKIYINANDNFYDNLYVDDWPS